VSRLRPLFVTLTAVLAFATATTEAVSADRGLALERVAVVDHVSDGDTIEVGIKGRAERVGLIGIDTPEVFGPVECGGPEASASMERLLKPGDRVKLVRDRSQTNRDYYGRLLRYVELKGSDLGRKQLRKGWASVYDTQEPFDREASYRRVAASARDANRGAWAECGGF